MKEFIQDVQPSNEAAFLIKSRGARFSADVLFAAIKRVFMNTCSALHICARVYLYTQGPMQLYDV